MEIPAIDNAFIEELKKRLNNPSLYHNGNALMGYPRSSVEDARKMIPAPKESAVSFLLFPRNDEWHTVFMLRPDGSRVHSNQLSFPGGKIEIGETAKEAALRETEEEVGIRPKITDIIGNLKEIYIPPSHYVVTPFVVVLKEEPNFKPSQDEVVLLAEIPVRSFLQNDITLEKEIYIQMLGKNIVAKYFDVYGHTLWGATAMMVQEFRELFGFAS